MARSIVEISGHIIDSLILPKILDLIVNLGAEFEILDIQIGHRRADRSHARVQVEASSEELLAEVLAKIREHGALPVEGSDEPGTHECTIRIETDLADKSVAEVKATVQVVR